MLDRFTSMSVFTRVVDRGSFTDAAIDCGMSATMVAKHIGSLERRLGAKLLNRTTRQQSLTEVGRLYYERCKQILDDVSDADNCAAEIRKSPGGLLKVHAPVSFGAQPLSVAIAHYLRRYPDLRIELTLADRHPDKPINLAEEGYDVAIAIGPLVDSGLRARSLKPYSMWVCASPAYLEQAGTPRTPRDLTKHNCLSHATWRRKGLWRFHDPDGSHDVTVDGQMIVNNGQALKAAAIAGLGVIMQPEVLLAEDVSCGRLTRILENFSPPLRPMYVVHQAERRPAAKLRSLVDFLVEEFG